MAGRFLNHAPGKRKAMRNANHNFSSISLVLSFLRTHLLLLLLVIQILCNSVGSASTTETTATGFKLNPVIVVIAFDRSSQLRHTLRSIAEASPPNFSIPIYVSVDDNPKAYRAIRAAETASNVAGIWRTPPVPSSLSLSARARISRHYHIALTRAFAVSTNSTNFADNNDTTTTHVIVLEDDLRLSPDALSFLLSSLPYLSHSSSDSTSPICASLWNDNAYNPGLRADAATLTSFFPGLGWALSKHLWEKVLSPIWPLPPSTVAPTGWDFWLRITFDQHNWTCITPQLPRVRHMSASGANVGSGQQGDQFLNTRYADIAAGVVQWSEEVKRVSNVEQFSRDIQQRLLKAPVAENLAHAKKIAHQKPVLSYRREDFAKTLAPQLGLWPQPRGYFRQTLVVPLESGGDILLYDMRRAGEHFELPSVGAKGVIEDVKFLSGARNVSCEEVCEREGLECSPSGLEIANDCHSMERWVGPCRACAYETGRDLPAKVVEEAGIDTRGLCLITETGMGEDGKLDCQGRFEWTVRNCVCVSTANEKGVNDGSTSEDSTSQCRHDEL